jgi:hypothetical protein
VAWIAEVGPNASSERHSIFPPFLEFIHLSSFPPQIGAALVLLMIGLNSNCTILHFNVFGNLQRFLD